MEDFCFLVFKNKNFLYLATNRKTEFLKTKINYKAANKWKNNSF